MYCMACLNFNNVECGEMSGVIYCTMSLGLWVVCVNIFDITTLRKLKIET